MYVLIDLFELLVCVELDLKLAERVDFRLLFQLVQLHVALVSSIRKTRATKRECVQLEG